MSGAGEPPDGVVILVGAGPGDPDLLTLRGADAIRSCDVVFYDELVPRELLDLAPPFAERINVGKRGHDPPTRSQDEIHELLIDAARAGKTVVRLKGGDPFVFGRGGEEASACHRAGVPFVVVPGVTSALAAPAAAGIPVTDRRHAASFAVVTGHKDPGRAAEQTRWAELARAVDTLVIVMGMRKLPELVETLLAGGVDPETPSAVVMDGSLPRQRVVEAPLAELVARVREAKIHAPAVVVIGEVVRLRASLAWWERTPLFGMRVLVTRAETQAEELARALRRAGAEPVRMPLLRVAPPRDPADLDRAIKELARIDVVVFSSANAVRALAAAAARSKVELAEVDVRTICIGQATARAAVEAGFALHAVAKGGAGGGAAALLAQLRETFPLAGQRVLLPQSEVARPELAQGLAQAGAEVDAVVAYRHRPPDVDAAELSGQIARGELDALTLTSPSAVAALLERLDAKARAALPSCIVVVIGSTTAAALRAQGIEPDEIAERPAAEALVEALVRHVRRIGKGGDR